MTFSLASGYGKDDKEIITISDHKMTFNDGPVWQVFPHQITKDNNFGVWTTYPVLAGIILFASVSPANGLKI